MPQGIRRFVRGVECIECPVCGVDYDRAGVVRELKKLHREAFDFALATLKFVCQICKTEIAVTV